MTPRPATLVLSNIAWDFIWQRHQTLASLFARDGDVVFCEILGTRRPGVRDAGRILRRFRRQMGASRVSAEALPSGITIARPFVVPAVNLLACALNQRLLARWLRTRPDLQRGVDLILDYSASRTALQLIESVPHRQLVYDCTDDWLSVQGVPAFLAADERALLARADVTFVPSRRLEELKRPLARRLVRLPHGVIAERFAVPGRSRSASEPVRLLYYGHIHRQHLDFVLLDQVARQRPDWRIELVGPVVTPHAFPANVELVGQLPHTRLRERIAVADVLLLPYVRNEYTRSVMPAKTYECLATGRPIVATPLPELVAGFQDILRFAQDATGFVAQVEEALVESPRLGETRRELAAKNSWDSRYGQIRDLLAHLPRST